MKRPLMTAALLAALSGITPADRGALAIPADGQRKAKPTVPAPNRPRTEAKEQERRRRQLARGIIRTNTFEIARDLSRREARELGR